MADGLCGPLAALGRRGCGRAGVRGNRSLTAQLSADTWPVTGEPYLLLEVPAAVLPSLAGFETAMDGLVPEAAHDDARIERHADSIVLVLHGRTYETVVPFDGWAEAGLCQIIVVETGLLPQPGQRREAALVDVINAGRALVAVNQIGAPPRPPAADC